MEIRGFIVALGNPGAEYRHTRHNFGWMLLERFVEKLEALHVTVEELRSPKGPFRLWRFRQKEDVWLLCEPTTYMNLSGKAVAPIVNFYHIAVEDILVLHDEIDLPLGKMRMKTGGGGAGHNGLKSLCADLGSASFARLRLGVGKPSAEAADPRRNVADYVLAKFMPEEEKIVESMMSFAVDALVSYLDHGFAATMPKVNSYKPE